MILRLFLFLLSYGLVFALPLYALGTVVRHRLQPWLDERRRRLRAREHAQVLAALDHARCSFCLQPCEESDCYDDKYGWYHHACLKSLLG